MTMILDNPLRRLRHSADLSLAQMEALGAGSRLFVMNAEAAMYPNPPDRILSILMEHYSYLDTQEITEEYHEYQRTVRVLNYGSLSPTWLDPSVSTVHYTPANDGHPFTAWREFSGISSRVRPCKLYCLHPGTMSRYELKPWLIANTPPVLTEALLQSGYGRKLLDTLDSRWVDYKQHLSQGVSHGIPASAPSLGR